MTEDPSLINTISLLYKNRKKILLACLIAAVVSSIASLLLPNYYESSTVFYPASSDLAKPLPTGDQAINRNYYGDGKDLDRLFSIAHSTELSHYLIRTFDLYQHYDIDSSKAKGPSQMMNKFNKLYRPVKSKFDAIILSVEDVDNVLAANMANAAREKISTIAQSLVKESQYSLLETYRNNIKNKEIGLEIISDSLDRMRAKFDIYNPTSQGKTYGELLPSVESQLFKSKSKLDAYINSNGPRDSIRKMRINVAGLEGQLDNLKERITKFNEGYSQVASLEREQNIFTEQLSFDKEKLKQLETTYNSPFAALHLVQEAEVSRIKSRPKRSLIVIGITALTGLLSIFVILLLHQIKEKGWREKIIN